MRRAARAARRGAQRVRFAVWARRLAFALRRAGGRLELDAPDGARFYELPRIEVHPHGGQGGVLRLRLGREVQLGRRLILEVWAGATNEVALGDRVRFSAGSRLQLFGGTLRIAEDASLRDGVLLNISGGTMILGREAQVRRDAILHCSERIEMGEYAGVAERVTVVDSDHSHDGSDDFYMNQPLRTGSVSIGRNTAVFANTIIMRGAHIGPNAVVGAAAMVRAGEYPGQTLYAGSPAEAVRPLGPAPTPR